MDRLTDSLRKIQSRLAAAGIPSAAIGAIAVAVWGEPRLTRDVDLKVLLGRDQASLLLDALADDYDAAGADPLKTLESYGMLFTRDPYGTRVDFLLSETDFDRQAIERAVEMPLAGTPIRVCRAEDLIVYKLLSTRPRDQADVETILIRQGEHLDSARVRSWLRQFEIALDDSTLIETFDRMLKSL